MDNSANMLQLCRLCLVKDEVNIPIFEEQGDIRQIFQKISSCLPVKVSQDDKLPKKICDGCSYKLDMCYEFWNTSANTEKQLLSWLSNLDVSEKLNDVQTPAGPQPAKPTDTDTIVKQEEIDPSDVQKEEEDDEEKGYMFQQNLEENNAGPSAAAAVAETNEDEPPPKRQRRTAAVKAAIAMDNDSDDDDDSGEPITKMEDESEDSDGDDNEPSYADVPSTSADDQPGPSGVGKDGADAPVKNSEMEEIVIKIVDDEDDNVNEVFYYDGISYFPKECQIKLPIEEIFIDVESGSIIDETTLPQKSPCTEDILCTVCGELITKYGLNKHMMAHDEGKQSRKSKELDPKIKYTCESCNFICEGAYEYGIHNFTHTLHYKCPMCKFSSKCRSSLFGHIKRHEGQFKYHCGICGRGFIGKALLATHEEIHLDIKRYTCELCGKKFSVKRYLHVHRQLNHKKELYGIEQNYKCNVCGREFTFEKSLRRHQSTIHRIGEDRTVQCPVCYKTIANNYNLKAHMRTHTGEKNYCCDLCGKVFSAYKYWNKHKLIHERKKEKNILEDINDNIKIDSIGLVNDYDNFENSFQM